MSAPPSEPPRSGKLREATLRSDPGAPAEVPAHFRVLGVPVRIAASFWLAAFLIGWHQQASLMASLVDAAVGGAVLFSSILLHELGHAMAARSFGVRSTITLHAFGGETRHPRLGRYPSLIVALAGPVAGFAFGALVLTAARHLVLGEYAQAVVNQLLFVNIGWGLVNLSPVIPFDGGHVLVALLGPRRLLLSSSISTLVGAVIAALAWAYLRSAWVTFLFGMAAVGSLRSARAAWSQRRDEAEGLPHQVEQARMALMRGALDDAMLLADDVVRRASTAPLRNAGLTMLAWVHVARGQGQLAREVLSQVEPRYAIDPYTLAAVEDCAGDPRRALDLLTEARLRGLRSPEATRLLIDLYVRQGHFAEATAVAIEDADILPTADGRAVVHALIEARELHDAARLAERLFEVHNEAPDAIDWARALSLAGDLTGALAALARAIAQGPIDLTALRSDGAFAPLVHDERFDRMVDGANDAC